MAVIEGTDRVKTAVGEYDFAVDGGAVGQITLRGSGALGAGVPNGAVITGGYVEVDTALTSGGAATAGVDLEATSDIVNGTVISGAPWSSTGRKSIIPAGTGATSVKTTAASRSLKLTIGVAALTAGKFRVVVFYR
jgi:hypothetical protein